MSMAHIYWESRAIIDRYYISLMEHNAAIDQAVRTMLHFTYIF